MFNRSTNQQVWTNNFLRLLLMGAVLSILLLSLTACQNGQSANSEDPFLTQILSQYPELEDQPYEIDTVQRIVDGDTFVTSKGDKVRMIGVNTPEVHGKVEAFGEEASTYTKEQLAGRTVYMFQDASSTDKYGRLLRYVFIDQDPLMYNDRLLIEGLANTMTIAPNVMYADHFVQLEQAARQQNKGLWGDKKSGSSSSASTSTNTAGCSHPNIKGNINSKNEKIYHVPGGSAYEQTKAEQYFCSEDEAVAAGFRKAKQ